MNCQANTFNDDAILVASGLVGLVTASLKLFPPIYTSRHLVCHDRTSCIASN